MTGTQGFSSASSFLFGLRGCCHAIEDSSDPELFCFNDCIQTFVVNENAGFGNFPKLGATTVGSNNFVEQSLVICPIYVLLRAVILAHYLRL